MLTHTTLVGLAAGVVSDSEIESQFASGRSGTQVGVAFCWVKKNGIIIVNVEICLSLP